MNNQPVKLYDNSGTKQSEKDSPQLSPEAILVRDTLVKNGLETPIIENGLNNQQKYQRIKELMTEVIDTLGLDLNDDSLAETPHRIAKMYVHEVFRVLITHYSPSCPS